MPQFQPELSDVIACIDIYHHIKSAQWLIESMKDAIVNHWEHPELKDHLAYLLDNYDDKMTKLIPEMDKAIEKVEAGRDYDEEWKDFINGNNE
jgi:hypothetical protein